MMKYTFLLIAIVIFSSCSRVDVQTLRTVKTTAKIASKALPINKEAELKIGKNVSDNLKGYYGVYQDEELTRYVTLVGLTIARKAERKDLKYDEYSFMVLETEEVNAYACPGGHIFLTLGLLKMLENEAQLACVLGHEINHVDKKHAIRDIQKANLLSAGAEELLKDENIRYLADKMTSLILAGYSRDKELESDANGAVLASISGYAPDQLAVFINRLKDLKGPEDKSSPVKNWFKMHPEMDIRIRNIESVIKDKKTDTMDLREYKNEYEEIRKRFISSSE